MEKHHQSDLQQQHMDQVHLLRSKLASTKLAAMNSMSLVRMVNNGPQRTTAACVRGAKPHQNLNTSRAVRNVLA